MIRVLIRTGIYRSSSSKEIQLSAVTWLVDKRSFEFTMGFSDGFYEAWLTPSVEIKKFRLAATLSKFLLSRSGIWKP